MKQTLLIAALAMATACSGQELKNRDGRSTGSVRKDGDVKNTYHSSTGRFADNGAVHDRSGTIVGYIQDHSRYENEHHNTIGYLESDGTVRNGSRTIIGYVKDDGTVQDARYNTIGTAGSMNKEWAAAYYFFFSFD